MCAVLTVLDFSTFFLPNPYFSHRGNTWILRLKAFLWLQVGGVELPSYFFTTLFLSFQNIPSKRIKMWDFRMLPNLDLGVVKKPWHYRNPRWTPLNTRPTAPVVLPGHLSPRALPGTGSRAKARELRRREVWMFSEAWQYIQHLVYVQGLQEFWISYMYMYATFAYAHLHPHIRHIWFI